MGSAVPHSSPTPIAACLSTLQRHIQHPRTVYKYLGVYFHWSHQAVNRMDLVGHEIRGFVSALLPLSMSFPKHIQFVN